MYYVHHLQHYTDQKQYARTQEGRVQRNTMHRLIGRRHKLRYIVAYYNGLTAPNDYKDEDISATIEELSFNLLERPKYMTMWSLNLEQFQAFQDELQDQAKLK